MKKRLLFLALVLLGCDNSATTIAQRTTVYKSETTPVMINAPVTATYQVTTLEFNRYLRMNLVHEQLVGWIQDHPNERIITILPYCDHYGCGGISIISTSTH